MSDLESGLKEAVEKSRYRKVGETYDADGQPSGKLEVRDSRLIGGEFREKPHLVPPDPFKAVRLRTRGALVSAHHDLKPRDGWAESDEIIWDMVTAWLDSLGDRR